MFQRACRSLIARVASGSSKSGVALIVGSIAFGGAFGVLPGESQNVVGSTLRAVTPFDGPTDDQPRLRAAAANDAEPSSTTTTTANATAVTEPTTTSRPGASTSSTTSAPSKHRPSASTTTTTPAPTPTTSNGKENYGAPITVDLQCTVLSGHAGVSCTWTATAVMPNASYTLVRANLGHTTERILAGNGQSTSAFTDTTGVAGTQYEYVVFVNMQSGSSADGRSNTVAITYS